MENADPRTRGAEPPENRLSRLSAASLRINESLAHGQSSILADSDILTMVLRKLFAEDPGKAAPRFTLDIYGIDDSVTVALEDVSVLDNDSHR